jgi:phosphoribosylformylglycinamidine cyclo-ligase
MYRTFNCGVGMVLVVAADQVDIALTELAAAGETAWVMGHIEADEASTTDADDTVRVALV